MKIFAIADLHFSSAQPKPMDIFGEGWEDHETKIRDNWNRVVESNDLVLIPGDISWAMKLEDAKPDLDMIGSFSGHKIIIRGNHDYWWSGISKVRNILPPTISAIQNDGIVCNGVAIIGTRGWLYPNSDAELPCDSSSDAEVEDNDMKIYSREVERLKLSLESLKKQSESFDVIIAMMHFMPFALTNTKQGGADSYIHEPTDFTNALESHGVSKCVYGHLHGEYHKLAYEGEVNGVEYRLVSCDSTDFTPVRIL